MHAGASQLLASGLAKSAPRGESDQLHIINLKIYVTVERWNKELSINKSLMKSCRWKTLGENWTESFTLCKACFNFWPFQTQTKFPIAVDWLFKSQIHSYCKLKTSFWSFDLRARVLFTISPMCYLAFVLDFPVWITLEISFQGTIRGLQGLKK